MLRMLKYPLLALAVYVIAAPLARANGERKEDEKAVVAVFAFDQPTLEKPRGEASSLFSSVKQPTLKDVVQRLKKAKDDFLKNYLVQLIEFTNGNISPAAKLAGKYRADLYEMLKKHKLNPADFRTKNR